MVEEDKLGAKWDKEGFYDWTPEAVEAWSQRLERYLAEFLEPDETEQ
jgi:hypothetical protein